MDSSQKCSRGCPSTSPKARYMTKGCLTRSSSPPKKAKCLNSVCPRSSPPRSSSSLRKSWHIPKSCDSDTNSNCYHKNQYSCCS